MKSRLPPSIFNDVLGPVMRGPSSSHSAASVRIGRMTRDLHGGTPHRLRLDFDTAGSLAMTHESQGSDMGLFGGILGWEADDPRLPDSRSHLENAGIVLEMYTPDLGLPHPNTYLLETSDTDGTTHTLRAISLGGGMIEVIGIDGFTVSIMGDLPVSLVLNADPNAHDFEWLSAHHRRVEKIQHGSGAVPWLIEGDRFLDEVEQVRIRETAPGCQMRFLHPVLPVPTPADLHLPFTSQKEMCASANPDETRLAEFALAYEMARGGIDRDAVLKQADYLIGIMKQGVQAGLRGTAYEDRILGAQSLAFQKAQQEGRLLDGGMLNKMILYVSALMEAKSSMEVIVAAPTAGSCATFPATCIAAAEALGLSDLALQEALLVGGLIGVFVATRSSFAAEVGGCQAETGAGSAMAAAALVDMMGGSATQALHAASLALQNVLGLVCDPVANRVEAPCLGRNVAGASNALASANMALAGYDALIPFDEVLDAHREISQAMPRELRCTALGGLSITPTSRAIEARLSQKCAGCQDQRSPVKKN